MHADLTDASVHVPTEVLTPRARRGDAPPRLPERPPAQIAGQAGQDGPPSLPTYDEIADRALELFIRRRGAAGQDLEDWLNAEQQLRLERSQRSAAGVAQSS